MNIKIGKNSKKALFACLIGAVCAVLIYADGKNEELTTWTKIVEKMEVHLNNAYELYTQGKAREAYDEVNAAYFRFYESKGMEKITMSYLSGARKTAVENAFYEYRRNVRSDKDNELVKAHKDMLVAMLYQDAADLGYSRHHRISCKNRKKEIYFICLYRRSCRRFYQYCFGVFIRPIGRRSKRYSTRNF